MNRGAATPCVEGFVKAFAERQAWLPGASVPWLRRSRSEALERLVALGLPTTRDEDWKYTSVAAIERRVFSIAGEASLDDEVERMVLHHSLDGTHRLVFVDGHYVAGLSRVEALPEGAFVESLALAASADHMEGHFSGDDNEAAGDGFEAANAALWSDGACVDLDPGVVLDMPVHLLFVSKSKDSASFPRNLIHVGANAGLNLIEQHVGLDEAAYLTDAITRIVVGEGARVAHAKLQQEGRHAFHTAGLRAEQGRDSRFESGSFAFGGQLSRYGVATRLGAEGCEAKLVGLYVGNARQHIDHHTTIDHASPHGTSREFYKGVLDDAARAVFNGRVIVRPDAQGTDAQQTNRNLLLSDDAEVDTKPQLEIWADDVKCAHGATVGQLDADQLYYLRSRGVDEAAARALLIRAFALETLEGIDFAPLRARLESLLPGQAPQAM